MFAHRVNSVSEFLISQRHRVVGLRRLCGLQGHRVLQARPSALGDLDRSSRGLPVSTRPTVHAHPRGYTGGHAGEPGSSAPIGQAVIRIWDVRQATVLKCIHHEDLTARSSLAACWPCCVA